MNLDPLYYLRISGQLFFCLGWWLEEINYTLSRIINLICGPLGSTSGHIFYMSTQNGSKLEVWPDRILIHALELKLWHFPICLYREAMHLQWFTPTHYVSGRGNSHVCTWRPLPDLLKLQYYRSLLALYGSKLGKGRHVPICAWSRPLT